MGIYIFEFLWGLSEDLLLDLVRFVDRNCDLELRSDLCDSFDFGSDRGDPDWEDPEWDSSLSVESWDFCLSFKRLRSAPVDVGREMAVSGWKIVLSGFWEVDEL